jgi:hypothetical protein
MDSTPNALEQGRTWVHRLPPRERFDRNKVRNKFLPQIAQDRVT